MSEAATSSSQDLVIEDAAEEVPDLDVVVVELPGGVTTGPARPARRDRKSLAITAAALAASLCVHAALAASAFFLFRSYFQPVTIPGIAYGDGAAETGLIDRPGETGSGPGAAGNELPAAALPDGSAAVSAASSGEQLRDAADRSAGPETPGATPASVPPPELRADLRDDLADALADAPPIGPAFQTSVLAVVPTSSRRPPVAPETGRSGPSASPGSGLSGSVVSAGAGAVAAQGQAVGDAAGNGATGDGGSAPTGRAGIPAAVRGRGLPVPAYPEDARRRGEQGTVVLSVEVLADGSCGHVEVVSDDGHPTLAAAAIAAVRRGRFTPALLDGKPVRSALRIPFRFRLDDGRHG